MWRLKNMRCALIIIVEHTHPPTHIYLLYWLHLYLNSIFFPQHLDQWTLNNALLHITYRIQQSSATSNRLLDHLANQVIQVFEDSCGDEWIGQTIECCVESGDGSHRYGQRLGVWGRQRLGVWGESYLMLGVLVVSSPVMLWRQTTFELLSRTSSATQEKCISSKVGQWTWA